MPHIRISIKKRLKIIEPIQNECLRIITGGFKSTPITSLQAETNMMPLERRRELRSLQYLARIHLVAESQIVNKINEIGAETIPGSYAERMDQLVTDMDIPITYTSKYDYNRTAPWREAPMKICEELFDVTKAEHHEKGLKILFQQHKELLHEEIEIYTDGSKREDGVGSAAVWEDCYESESLLKQASIMTAELYAIKIALEKIASMEGSNFVIFSDSRSALQAINIYHPLHPVVIKIRQLNTGCVRKGKHTTFCWVPAHVGIRGNEEADKRANEAAGRPEKIVELPHTDFNQSMKDFVKERWQHDWNKEALNKLYQIKPNLGHWHTANIRTRHEETILARLRMGHTHITHHHLMQKDEPTQCEECHVQITVLHMLAECPKYSRQRSRHFPCINLQMGAEDRLKMILSEGHHYALSPLMGFLRETKLYDLI
jgi:ribonuclease HI